ALGPCMDAMQHLSPNRAAGPSAYVVECDAHSKQIHTSQGCLVAGLISGRTDVSEYICVKAKVWALTHGAFNRSIRSDSTNDDVADISIAKQCFQRCPGEWPRAVVF